MSKHKDLSYYEGCWWLQPHIDWNSIGADVTSRPTEREALNNISLEVKYIRKLNKWELGLTKQEYEIYKLDLLVNSKEFDIEKYRERKVYRKDTLITKLSKISNYSEQFIRNNLNNISRKMYLCSCLGIELVYQENTDNNKYLNQKRNMIYKKTGRYKNKKR